MPRQFSEACSSLNDTQRIIRARGESYTCVERSVAINIENTTHQKVFFIKMDGGLFQGNACDWGVCDDVYSVGALVELKGGDITHAIQQLKRTNTRLKTEFMNSPRIKSAYVVCHKNHLQSTSWQQAAAKFYNETGMRLERRKSRQETLKTKKLFLL